MPDNARAYEWYDDNDTEARLEDSQWIRDRVLRKANRERRRAAVPPVQPTRRPGRRQRRGPTRAARLGQEAFKCRHCRAFMGPTVGGGRHRNHCAQCLYSRHVDDRRPGDRATACGALMAPVGQFARPGGESVIVHRCLGCGLERHNRLAADDNVLALVRLPLVAPRLGQREARPHHDISQEADEQAGLLGGGKRQIS